LLWHINELKAISNDNDSNIFLGHLKLQFIVNDPHPKRLQNMYSN
jgi:hypothetical protein